MKVRHQTNALLIQEKEWQRQDEEDGMFVVGMGRL